MDVQGKLTFRLAFEDQGGPLHGLPVCKTLARIGEFVTDHVVSPIEHTCLGPFGPIQSETSEVVVGIQITRLDPTTDAGSA